MIDAKTKICCIIGNPVDHSLSPQMHNAGYKVLGINFRFVAFQVTDVKQALSGIRALGIQAVAVTIPHKLEVMQYVDQIDEVTKKIGAVNTIINENGVLRGANTDWIGAIKSLEEKTTLSDKRVALLGSGGAARAVAYGLKEKGAHIVVFNRTLSRAEKLAQDFHLDGYFTLERIDKIKEADIIVNTTSVGMQGKENISPIPRDAISSNMTVFDIVYTPHETKLLQYAKQKRATRIYGYKMILYGGCHIFELATEKKAPIEIMEKTLLQNLSKPK